MLVRKTARLHEFAVRAALGSGRWRLVRQFLVESSLLAGLGGLFGVALAAIGVGVLRDLGRDALPRLRDGGLDPAVLGFATLATVATAIGSGLMPALRVSRVDPNRVLGQQARGVVANVEEERIDSGCFAALSRSMQPTSKDTPLTPSPR